MNHALSKLPRQTFGDIIRTEREDQGLSHRDIGTRVGVDRETVKAWERNERFPNRHEMKKLFGSMKRLRHYVHLLPTEIRNGVAADAATAQEPLPEQLAPIEPPPAPAPKTFGEALKRARLREGLDQYELGEIVGVTGQAVSYWESETNTPIRDHYSSLISLLPELKDAPQPEMIRDIEKPGVVLGLEQEPDEIPISFYNEPTPKEEPMNRSPVPSPIRPQAVKPEPQPHASTPDSVKLALIRWGRLVHALKTAPNASQFTDFLVEARDAGMSLKDVMEALDDPK